MRALSLFGLLFFAVSGYSQFATVTWANANLLGTPDTTGKVVDKVAKDTKLRIIEQNGTWFLVQTPDYVGWMESNTIRIDSTGATTVESGASKTPSGATSASRSPSLQQIKEATGYCGDGTPTYSIDKQCACSGHDGVASWFADDIDDDAPSASGSGSTSTYSGSKTVHVRGYTRKNGTSVTPHTRSSPRR